MGELDGKPATAEGLHGELEIDNDDQIMIVCFVDEAVYERVSRAAKDAASLAAGSSSEARRTLIAR